MRPSRAAMFLVAMLLSPILLLAGADKDKKKDVDAIGERRVARRSIISQEKEIAIGKQYASEIDRSGQDGDRPGGE